MKDIAFFEGHHSLQLDGVDGVQCKLHTPNFCYTFYFKEVVALTVLFADTADLKISAKSIT